jgi:hypothetical protein
MDGDGDGAAPRLGRRLLVLRVAGLGAAAGTLTGCVVAQPVPVYSGPVRTGITDADPGDGPGQGRGGYAGNRARTGFTDADPQDGPGFGRGGFRPARTGITDADPQDGPGQGRGGFRGRGRTGFTDSDPSDGPGQGRGGYRRQISDSDPRDPPGRGRGW